MSPVTVFSSLQVDTSTLEKTEKGIIRTLRGGLFDSSHKQWTAATEHVQKDVPAYHGGSRLSSSKWNCPQGHQVEQYSSATQRRGKRIIHSFRF